MHRNAIITMSIPELPVAVIVSFTNGSIIALIGLENLSPPAPSNICATKTDDFPKKLV